MKKLYTIFLAGFLTLSLDAHWNRENDKARAERMSIRNRSEVELKADCILEGNITPQSYKECLNRKLALQKAMNKLNVRLITDEFNITNKKSKLEELADTLNSLTLDEEIELEELITGVKNQDNSVENQ